MRAVALALALLALTPAVTLAQSPAPAPPASPSPVDAALGALRDAKDTQARMAAILELGRARDPGALDPLLRALRDPNRDVRWVAVEALGELGDRRAVAPLVAYLQMRRKEVYRWHKRLVANALGAIGGGEAVEALTAMLADPDLFVRRSAALGLIRQGDPVLLARLDGVMRESPDDHLATVKREYAKLRESGAGRARVQLTSAAAPRAAPPLGPHEWLGLRVGRSTANDASERLGAPLQRTADYLLFRGDTAPAPVRTESVVVNAGADGVIESIFVFPVWGTLDRDVRGFLGHGRILTYGEFLRITGRTTFGAGTRADGKLHYLPPDLLTESFPDLGMLVVYDSADVAARDRLVKLLVVY